MTLFFNKNLSSHLSLCYKRNFLIQLILEHYDEQSVVNVAQEN